MAEQNRIRRFKLAPPPPELPIYGTVNPEDCSFIGKTNYEAALQEQKYIFGIILTARKNSHASACGRSSFRELNPRPFA